MAQGRSHISVIFLLFLRDFRPRRLDLSSRRTWLTRCQYRWSVAQPVGWWLLAGSHDLDAAIQLIETNLSTFQRALVPCVRNKFADSVPPKGNPHAGPVLGSRNIIGEISFVRAEAACGGWVQVLSDLVVEQLRPWPHPLSPRLAALCDMWVVPPAIVWARSDAQGSKSFHLKPFTFYFQIAWIWNVTDQHWLCHGW